MPDKQPQRYQFFDQHPEIADFREDIIRGLSAPEPYILPKYFYDETGSRLFEDICNTQEYYPTRTEVSIIRNNIDDIVNTLGKDCLLIEPGSGDSYKVRLLLDALRPVAYLPIDISRRYLQDEAQKLAAEFTWLNVHAVCADFTGNLELPYHVEAVNKVAFFPGSTIGNFLPQQAVTVLREIRMMVGDDGGLLIGVDLQKESAILNAAYNDREGFTEQFNKNLLLRINRELGADFDLEQFEHLAFFNKEKHRIEMHLVSRQDQHISIGDQVFKFEKGQRIHTEYSHKYTVEHFQQLAREAGFNSVKTWLDEERLFSVHYLQVAGPGA
ncbi:MAG: L-histidine N(alpha)-methyltransferase [Gammaproteobacteria bacterium]|nr:L-histidine N(alpha)-methyltransferase [Gammaproteobacteria bacterium]MBT8134263.1 L-histidine N(alpha)-methyltransferase [Gammaproteobacteria bacterium]NNJ49900.1 L-histidine N(alpha)-methyltransferase [Gammaproteobacteria bacterium]